MDDASQPMTGQQILENYDFFDQAIVEHGFTPYNRDYRLVAGINVTGFTPGYHGSEYVATDTFWASIRLNTHAAFPNSILNLG